MNWSQFTPVPGAVQPEALQRSLDVSGLPALDRGSGYYDRATDALLGRFALRAQPRFQRETEALETRLRNRGLRPGDEAYDQALRELRDAQQDAWTGATYDAIIRGGQEAARMFGMDAEARRQLFGEQAQAGQFANQAAGQAFAQGMNAAEFQARLRQQQIAEEMQRRGFTLNEINALLEGQQVGLPQMPSFMGAGRAEAPQYLNAAQAQYQSSLDAFNARNALFGSLLGAITSPFSFGFNFGR
ncbi:MAG: hypothetical protein NZ534_00025 [Bacteroidia bacterium]|nr:hypothetical protein [Bacteroidia bacterium]